MGHSGEFGVCPVQATRHVLDSGKSKASRVRASPGVLPWHHGNAVGRKGPARALIQYISHGMRCGMQDLGIQSVTDLHRGVEDGTVRMECQTALAAQTRELCRQTSQRAAHPEVFPAIATVGGEYY